VATGEIALDAISAAEKYRRPPPIDADNVQASSGYSFRQFLDQQYACLNAPIEPATGNMRAELLPNSTFSFTDLIFGKAKGITCQLFVFLKNRVNTRIDCLK